MENSDPLAPSPLSQPTAPSPREQLGLPEKVSIRWLVERVPISWWFWAASGVVAIFSSGLTAGLWVDRLQQVARPSEHSSEDIDKIKQLQLALRDASRQQKTLRMPLEGVWDYKTQYTKYFGEDNTNPKKPQRYLNGKAIFIWHGDGKRVGYEAYMGAGIYEVEKSEPFVTLLLEFFLDTDKLRYSKAEVFNEWLLHSKNDIKQTIQHVRLQRFR